ncbi:copper chaperone PCu(A)C [Elioraea sp.]|uniref:copper chaperone PCu(A)C n=1 Tax=Elioraea sp. TaxID=2185103 RepID=UPI0025BDA188|nr:copper chaperone PCu(A)C [Elioraea sp.]
MTTRRIVIAAGFAAIVAAPANAQAPISVQEPWARAALQGRTSAAYMTIENTTAALDRLVSATSPVARVVELHTHMMDGAVMRMRPVSAIEVNPGEPAVLRPGGLHIMLIDLARPLRAGETIPLTLRFEKAGEVTVNVAVQAAGASGPGQHGHGTQHRH